MYSLSGRHICLLYLWQLVWKLYTHVYNAHEVLSWQSQIFYICKTYIFFHIYDPWHIPCLPVIFVFYKCLWSFYCNSYKHFTCVCNTCLSTSMITYRLLVLQIYFLTHANIFWNVHTCVYIPNTNVHKVLSSQQWYFTIVSHICSFTSMIPLEMELHVWQT